MPLHLSSPRRPTPQVTPYRGPSPPIGTHRYGVEGPLGVQGIAGEGAGVAQRTAGTPVSLLSRARPCLTPDPPCPPTASVHAFPAAQPGAAAGGCTTWACRTALRWLRRLPCCVDCPAVAPAHGTSSLRAPSTFWPFTLAPPRRPMQLSDPSGGDPMARRASFSTRKFAAAHSLGDPVAVTW